MPATDNELIERICQGDEVAFELLLSRYEKRIYNYILRWVGNPQDAQDVFQDVFLKVYRNAHRYEPARGFSCWLYTIARNSCIDRLRSKPAKVERSLEEPVGEGRTREDTLAESPDTHSGPLQEAIVSEMQRQVRSAIESLPDKHKEVVLLRHYEGLSFREIARVLDLRLGTVKSRFHYALQSLSEKLEPLSKEFM